MKDSRICTNQKLYRWNTCLNQNRLWSLLASVLKHRGLETPSLCAAMWPLCLLSGCCNVISIDSAIHMSCQNLSGEAVPFVCGLRAASCQLLCVQNGNRLSVNSCNVCREVLTPLKGIGIFPHCVNRTLLVLGRQRHTHTFYSPVLHSFCHTLTRTTNRP